MRCMASVGHNRGHSMTKSTNQLAAFSKPKTLADFVHFFDAADAINNAAARDRERRKPAKVTSKKRLCK